MFVCHISILNKFGKLLLDKMLLSFELQWREMVVLLVLDWSPGCSQSYLFEYLQTDKGNVTKLINRMEADGFIERRVDSRDKRYRRLYLQPKGQALVPGLYEVMQQWEDRCFEGLSCEQRESYQQLNKQVMEQMLKLLPPKEDGGRS